MGLRESRSGHGRFFLFAVRFSLWRDLCTVRGMSKTILLVGHCGVDGPRLKDELSRALPSAKVEHINSDEDLHAACQQGADLLLVNREPVGFDCEGLDLIREVKSDHPDCKVMLVSDRADAQRLAVDAGAMKGFGKSEMGSPALAEHVKQALT